MTNDYEKIAKRVNRFLPNLIINGDPLGLGRDIMDYRLMKFKQHNRNQCATLENQIIRDIVKLRTELNAWWNIYKNK